MMLLCMQIEWRNYDMARLICMYLHTAGNELAKVSFRFCHRSFQGDALIFVSSLLGYYHYVVMGWYQFFY